MLLLLPAVYAAAGIPGFHNFAAQFNYLDTNEFLNKGSLSTVSDTVRNWEQAANMAGDQEFAGQLHLFLLIRAKEEKVLILDSFEHRVLRLVAAAKERKLKYLQAELEQTLGNFYSGRDEHQSAAIDHYLAAYAIYKNLSPDVFPARQSYIATLGGIYYRYEDYENAIKYLQDALNTKQSVNNNQFCSVFNTIGLSYRNMKVYDSAILYFQKSYDNAVKLNNKVWKGITQGNIGITYFYQKKYYQAVPLLQEDVEICLNTNNIQNAVGSMGILASIYNLEGDQDSAEVLLHQALTLAESRPFWPKYALAERLFTQLFKVYEAKKNFRLAALYADSAMAAKDSVASRNYALTLSKAKEKQNFLEHKLEDEQLKSQVAIGLLEISKSRIEIISTIIGIAILLVVLIFVARERKRSDNLLLNILPEKIAERLKKKEHPIADYFEHASVLFIDMAGFTIYTEGRDPKEIVNMLNEIFSRFDMIADKYRLEKIKTIGDCYMAVSGLPEPRPDHAEAATRMALEIRQDMKGFAATDGTPITFRLGLDCGPVVAGVIGRRKFIYDLWGDTVNTASRMETTGLAGEIHCTDRFKSIIEKDHRFSSRSQIEIKGKGLMDTWLILE